ncbi:Unconventional myosin-XVIIIa [Sergentomyia squamirostris]
MAVYHVQKSFEQSLRSSSPYPALLPPNILKPEIHKGCTGKAHACGTIKMMRNGGPKIKAVNGNRKNSLSSETVSDSGSEISSQNSFNGTLNNVRRRTVDSVNGLKDVKRSRLYSDGDKEEPDKDKVDCSPSSLNRLQHSRSFRVTSSRNGGIKPPWQNFYGKQSPPAIPSIMSTPSPNGVSRSSSFNSRYRSSFRRRNDIVQWTQMWEKSFTQRGDGGVYKPLDKIKLNQTKIEGDDGPWTNAANGENVWLVHRGGFCAATRFLQKNPGDGKVLIELTYSGEQLSVDEDDIEKANPSKLDLVEDICQLKHLNEASVLHCLRQRYASNLIHTKAGPTLMVVNPMAPLSLYSEKVVSMFRGCKTEDMPPHVYSLAQTAYRTMLETRRDQSLIFMGRSGSGKTTSFKHALYYLALAAGSVNKLLTAEKVNAINTILEAFGNAKTCMNSNATRFTQILSLDFDHSGQIASASVQVLLLERNRCGRRMGNDCTFHVLTRLLAGAEGSLQKELHLDNISSDDNNPFVQLPQKLEDRQKASAEFVRLVQAFSMLNVEASSVKALWHVLAAIYHLGVAGVTKIGIGATARTQFANPSAARRAATLLGISMEDLTSAAFQSGSSSPARSPTDTADASWDGLEALIVGLYSETMAAVVSLVNKAISTSAHTIASILLLDSPGFQNPASCGQQSGATLSDLRHNYLQERLQLLFHHVSLVAPRDRYAQELVELDGEGVPDSNPAQLVSLIDKAPQSHVVRTSQRDLREQDRRGLLWLLDEESIYPNSNDDTFYERLFNHYGDREHQNLLRRASGSRQFILQHLQGTNPVLYSASGWLKASKEHPATKSATTLLQDSSKEDISRLFISAFGRGNGAVFCGSIAGMEGSQSLRRVSSIRRSFTTAGVKRNSLMLQVKFTVDGIIDTVRRTGTHFVQCFMLQHNAGNTSGNSQTSPQHTSEDIVNVPLLRSQLRGSQILEAARLHRLGFPESVPLNEFIRRFGLLGDVQIKDQTVEQILSSNEIDPSTYRIGPSQFLSTKPEYQLTHSEYT